MNGGEGHNDDDRLELYALRRLPTSEVEKVEEHLLICDSCRDRLDEIAAFAFSTRTALKEMPKEQSPPLWRNFSWLPNIGLWRPGLTVAGAVAVLMLAIGIYRVWQGGPLVPVATLHLTEIRGARIPIASPARELDIDFADAGAAFRVVIVNAQRTIVWTGMPMHGLTDTSVKVQTALPEGEYFATVYTKDGAVISEYEFRIAR